LNGLEKLCNTVSIEQVLVDMGFNIDTGNSRQQIKCPFKKFHQDGDFHPSARIYNDTNKLYCFTEKKVRNVVQIVSELKGIPKNDAINIIVKKYLKHVDLSKYNKNLMCTKKIKEEKLIYSYFYTYSNKLIRAHQKIRKLFPDTMYIDSVYDYIFDVADNSRFRELSNVVDWYFWAKKLYKNEILQANKIKLSCMKCRNLSIR